MGELTALPKPLAGGDGAGCPLPEYPTPALGPLGLGLWPFGPSALAPDPRKLGPHNMMGWIRLSLTVTPGVARNFRKGVRQSVAFLSVHSRFAALPTRPYNQKTHIKSHTKNCVFC